MKVKTNVRAGKKSGTIASGNKGGGSEVEVETTSTAPAPVVYTRCVGI